MRKWKMHALAQCCVCGKEWTDYRTALRLAGAHAKRTGHEVHGEVAYAVRWNEEPTP